MKTLDIGMPQLFNSIQVIKPLDIGRPLPLNSKYVLIKLIQMYSKMKYSIVLYKSLYCIY
jgi:hypothetical protein